MKKFSAVLLIFILIFIATGANCAYYPSHIQENKAGENTRAVNVVINNTVDIEETVATFLQCAAATENTDFYLYTMKGNHPVIKVEFTEECINNIMKNYAKKVTAITDEMPAYIRAVEDLGKLENYEQKELCFIMYNTGDFSLADRKAFLSYVRAVTGYKVAVYDYQDHFYSDIERENSNLEAYDYLNTSEWLKQNGYTQIPGQYYDYDRETGLVTIEQGRADANIYVYAQASKDDYLYISGYMATGDIYEANKDKKTIKGVSLGYNPVNLEKTESPKNIACQLFSVDEELYDVNSNSFVIPVKNAESVTLYYNSAMGSGVCSKNSKYNREQDDKIINRYAKVVVEENDKVISSAPKSVTQKVLKSSAPSSYGAEKKDGFFKRLLILLLNFFLGIFSFVWSTIRLLLLVLIVLMAINPTIRHNVLAWLFRSKAGPFVEKCIFTGRSLWAALTKKEKPQHINMVETLDNVFISHSSQDRKIPENRIEKVLDELDSRGIKYWISSKNLKSGDRFGSEIKYSIQDCSVFVLFVSKASLASPDVKNEMGLANKYKKKILPIQIEKFDPMTDPDWEYWFTNCQIENVFENNPELIAHFVDNIEMFYNKAIEKRNK